MSNHLDRLKDLREELASTYLKMNHLLEKNNIRRIRVADLPPEDYKEWRKLNLRSTELINEFSVLIGENINPLNKET